MLKLHNLWVLEVFLTEQEVADIKECRANLLERSTAKHTLSEAVSKRREYTRSPRPHGTWRRNMTPSFQTGIVNASKKISERGSGRDSLISPTWMSKRKNIEAVPSPVQGYHIEADFRKEPSVEPSVEILPEKPGNTESDDVFYNDKLEVPTSIEITKQTSRSNGDSFHTPPSVSSLKDPLAAPSLENIEDVTPEEPTSDVPSSVDAPLHISSTSTLVKSAEIPAHSISDHLDTQPQKFYSTSSSGSSSSNEINDNHLQLPEDSISLVTAEDSQQSHYGSVDEDKTMNLASLAEEISKLKDGDKEILVEESMIHENGWVDMDFKNEELSNNTMCLDTPHDEKKQEFPVKDDAKNILPELHNNCNTPNHDSSDVLLPDKNSPNEITSSNITSPKPLKLLNHDIPVVVSHDDDTGHEPVLVDSGNGEDAGVSPTLSSVSCSDGRSSCHSSNLYTPQTASSEVQDNEVMFISLYTVVPASSFPHA